MTIPPERLHYLLTHDDPESLAARAALWQQGPLAVSIRELAYAGADGLPVVHRLAELGLLDRVDPAHLEPGLVSLRARNGENLLHGAARSGTLDHIPLSSQTPAQYRCRCHQGFAPMHYAARADVVGQVPTFILNDASVLTVASAEGNLPLHTMAREGSLDQLADGTLTRAMLAWANLRGVTVAHEAMESRQSLLVVAPLLDPELLGRRDHAGVTPEEIMAAGLDDYQDDLPAELRDRGLALLRRDPGLRQRVRRFPLTRAEAAAREQAQAKENHHAEIGLRIGSVTPPQFHAPTEGRVEALPVGPRPG